MTKRDKRGIHSLSIHQFQWPYLPSEYVNIAAQGGQDFGKFQRKSAVNLNRFSRKLEKMKSESLLICALSLLLWWFTGSFLYSHVSSLQNWKKAKLYIKNCCTKVITLHKVAKSRSKGEKIQNRVTPLVLREIKILQAAKNTFLKKIKITKNQRPETTQYI